MDRSSRTRFSRVPRLLPVPTASLFAFFQLKLWRTYVAYRDFNRQKTRLLALESWIQRVRELGWSRSCQTLQGNISSRVRRERRKEKRSETRRKPVYPVPFRVHPTFLGSLFLCVVSVFTPLRPSPPLFSRSTYYAPVLTNTNTGTRLNSDTPIH